MLDEKRFGKLREAVRWSEKKLLDFRRVRKNALKQYVGKHYGVGGTPDKAPVNMIELAVNIFQRQIASSNPQVLVTTQYKQLKPTGYKLQLAMNYLLKKMQIDNALNTAGVEALFMAGVLKVGICSEPLPALSGAVSSDTGDVMVQPVLFEDFICDMSAKRWEHVGYIGNRYRMPLDWVKANESFDPELRQKVVSSGEYANQQAKDYQSDTIAKGTETHREEFDPYCDLIDLFLPREQILVTYAADENLQQPLRVIEWTGPRHGPYHVLSFEDVPGNLIPLSPVQLWVDLNEAINVLANKIIRQAQDQKTVLGVMGHATKDGERVVDANDGDAILMENPEAAREFKFRGADQGTMGATMWLRDLYSYVCGNLDMIGGLAPGSDTVGQDSLMRQASSQRVQDMQQKMLKFATAVIRDIAFYIWNDPLISVPISMPLGKSGVELDGVWDATNRNGDFIQYAFDLEPYAMRQQTPAERAASVMQFTQNILLPLAPLLAQSGMVLDAEKLLRMFGNYLNLPELIELVQFQRAESYPEDQAGPPPTKGPTKPSQTTRNYVRNSRNAGISGSGRNILSLMKQGAGDGES